MARFIVQLEQTEVAFVMVDADSLVDANRDAQLNAYALMRDAKDRQVMGGPRVTHVLPEIVIAGLIGEKPQ